MPQPWGGLGWLVSSPAMNRRGLSGKKQICALMSRPLGSSLWLRMTVCFSKGAAVLIALRLLPSPLNTTAGAGAAVAADVEVRAPRPLPLPLSLPLLHAVAASATARALPSIRRPIRHVLLFESPPRRCSLITRELRASASLRCSLITWELRASASLRCSLIGHGDEAAG